MAHISATVPLLLNRQHEINKAIDTQLPLRSSRFFPAALDLKKLPLITVVPGRAEIVEQSHDLKRVRREFLHVVYVGFFSMGVPMESALHNAERLIDPIYQTYFYRPRLELIVPPRGAPQGALAGVVSAEMQGDTGVIPEVPDRENPLAVIRFTLLIETLERL